jgi:enhancing lycopene biosynthesis protein 2
LYVSVIYGSVFAMNNPSPCIAVILSGCGHLDGAEIRESVLSLLYLDQRGATVHLFAPDMPQTTVVNHSTNTSTHETRNVLQEASRIARGHITPLSLLEEKNFDALLLPGGFGVATNLSDFASKGIECSIYPEMQRVVRGFYEAKKPIGAICISPAILSTILQDEGMTLTIGNDPDTAFAIAACGNHHQTCDTAEAVIDEAHRIASCSAYMRHDAKIADVAKGIEQVVDAVLAMISPLKR